MLHDLLLAGDPLHSLTDTRDNAETLQRITGLDDVPLTVPRRLGEILREPGLLGAAAGGILVLAFMRRRAALPIAAGFVALAAFCVLAAAGLPILGRYLLLPATLLAIFCGAGVFGWLQLPPDHPWRQRWAAIGARCSPRSSLFAPAQVDRIARPARRRWARRPRSSPTSTTITERDPVPARRGPQPPAGAAHRALDRHPAERDRLRAARAPTRGRLRRPRERARASATSRSTRATRSG